MTLLDLILTWGVWVQTTTEHSNYWGPLQWCPKHSSFDSLAVVHMYSCHSARCLSFSYPMIQTTSSCLFHQIWPVYGTNSSFSVAKACVQHQPAELMRRLDSTRPALLTTLSQHLSGHLCLYGVSRKLDDVFRWKCAGEKTVSVLVSEQWWGWWQQSWERALAVVRGCNSEASDREAVVGGASW